MESRKLINRVEHKFRNSKTMYLSLLILCAVLFAVMFVKLYSISRESFVSNEYISIDNTARKVEYVLKSYIDQVYECEAMIEEMIADGKTNSDILTYLAMEHDAIYLVAGEQYIDIYGYIRGEHLDGAFWEPPEDYIPTERPWYVAAVENKGNISMAGPYVDAMTGSTVISYAITLADDMGVVSYDVMLDDLQVLISDFAGDEYERALLVSDDDAILIDSLKKYGCMNLADVDDPLVSATYDGFRENKGENYTFMLNGETYYVYNLNVSFNMHYLVIGKTKTMFPLLKRTTTLGILLFFILVFIEASLLRSMNAHRKQIESDLERIQKLYKEANTDKLSGLGNRRAYEQQREELKNKGVDGDFVYAALDLNGLKEVNDIKGHDSGDIFIRDAAEIILSSFSAYGTVYRTGGDEFVALLNMTQEELENARREVKRKVEEHNTSSEIKISVSVGFATLRQNEQLGFDELAQMADKAMYEQKARYYSETGKDRRKR